MSVSYEGSETKYRLSITAVMLSLWFFVTMLGGFLTTGVGQLGSVGATVSVIVIVGFAILAKMINPYPEHYFRLEFADSELTGPAGHGFNRERQTVILSEPFRFRHRRAHWPHRHYEIHQGDRTIWLSNAFLSTEDLDKAVAKVRLQHAENR